jgi:hypothetical protein
MGFIPVRLSIYLMKVVIIYLSKTKKLQNFGAF